MFVCVTVSSGSLIANKEIKKNGPFPSVSSFLKFFYVKFKTTRAYRSRKYLACQKNNLFLYLSILRNKPQADLGKVRYNVMSSVTLKLMATVI